LEDLLSWCARRAGGGSFVAELGTGRTLAATRAQALFAEAIAMRELIYQSFSALAAAAPGGAVDLGALEAAIAQAPPRQRLARWGPGYAWCVEQQTGRGPPCASELLAAVLWSAADLVAKDGEARVRQCANDACRWLFLDASRIGSRRWCDMRSCGNRAKAQRHYRKRIGA
jgi:predicted RNA-binding Zn ribbon-like protein